MKRYYPSLDILKAALALFIVATHTGILNDSLYPILRIAVPSFFIISGFSPSGRLVPVPPPGRRTRCAWAS